MRSGRARSPVPVRELLPRSFHALFGRFEELTPIQSAAVPPIVHGSDVLIASPTASGKTEAFAAPAAELVLGGERGGARVLFVSPTRALANDLKRRLESRFLDLGVGFGRYTGEHKERKRADLAEITITTPESLDSLLARRPERLAEVRLIVLDEIHVLDGSPRGDQLRVLLHRLEQAARVRPQRIAVSATIEDPEGATARYLKAGVIASVPGRRRIRARRFDGATAVDLAGHLDDLVSHGLRKILVFCNRRADVEEYATRLAGRCVFGEHVFSHHGSLARRLRERTERRFLEAPAGVAIATMTLELGIDIGTVDYVLLASPPSDVASVLQRIGRGGRRGEVSRMGYVVADPGQALRYDVLLRAAARGELHGHPYAFRPAVFVQQALVLACSRGWIDAATLTAASPRDLLEELAPAQPIELLEALAAAGQLVPARGGRFVPSDEIERRYDRGHLHSNISTEILMEVVDRLTGDVIGHLPPPSGRRMNLGGAARRIVHETDGRILADRTDAAGSPGFQTRGSPFCSLALARAVVARLGVGESEVHQLEVEGATFVLHGLGTAGALLLQTLLRETLGADVIAASPWVLSLRAPIAELPRPEPAWTARFVGRHERALARLCGAGPGHRHLPLDVRLAAVEKLTALEDVVGFLAGVRFVRRTAASEEQLERVGAL